MIRLRRREHVRHLAWGMVAASGGLGLVGGASALLPRVRRQPHPELDAGRPGDYDLGEVSERYLRTHKVLIVRDEDGIHALSAVCTHLGCIVRPRSSREEIRCFCHGSGFDLEGRNLEGPAPRPLERLRVRLGPGERLLVDPRVRYREELGEWDSEGALLPWPPETSHG